MKQEDKQLLLQDLCARLPYGVKFKIREWNTPQVELTIIKHSVLSDNYVINEYYKLDDIKPYLRPLSSMTEEEKKELLNHVLGGKGAGFFHVTEDVSIDGNQNAEQELYNLNLCWISFDPLTTSSYLDWLNSHHFDYRGLIEKGLAIAVIENDNPYKLKL